MNELKVKQYLYASGSLRYVTTITLTNTYWAEKFKDEPLYIVEFTSGKPEPLEFEGETMYPWYLFGSASKQKKFFMVAKDYLEPWAKYAEDSYRGGRALLSQGWFGYGELEMNIKQVPPGTIYNGRPVEDGFGYINTKVANAIYTGQEKIKLSKGQGSYSFWQNIPATKEIKEELYPLILKRLEEYNQVHYALEYSGLSDKQKWVDLNDDMKYHPSVVNPLRRSIAEYLARISTTAPHPTYTRLAVPTTYPTIASTQTGALWRNPIDNHGSIQAMDGDPDAKEEEERIAEMEAIQYSLTTDTQHWKGCLSPVEDLDCDIVFCTEDIKMGEFTPKVKGFLTFLSWWDKGSCMGVNAEWGKELMSLDHDGDLVQFILLPDSSAILKEVRKFPNWPSPKLKKVKTERNQFNMRRYAESVVPNLVGYAANARAHALGLFTSFEDQNYLATSLGYESAQSLHKRLNYYIHAGTDLKTWADREGLLKQTHLLNGDIGMFIPRVPYTGWPNTYAFTHHIPHYIYSVENDLTVDGMVTHYFDKDGVEIYLDERAASEAVLPGTDNLISWMYSIYEPEMRKNGLDMMLPANPLSHYIHWVPKPDKADLEWARGFRDWYNALVARQVMSDKMIASDIARKVYEEAHKSIGKRNELRMAKALWWVLHSSRTEWASATAVFNAFPKSCEWIMKNAIKRNVKKSILVGVQYQVPQLESWEGDIVVQQIDSLNRYQKAERRFIVRAKIEGQQEPKKDIYPKDMIGVIEQSKYPPKQGVYRAKIKKVPGQKAWELLIQN